MMDIKTMGIGAGIGAAVTTGVIFGIQGLLKSAHRKGKNEGTDMILRDQSIAQVAVAEHEKKRFSFLKRKES